jgi:hypothetical protein
MPIAVEDLVAWLKDRPFPYATVRREMLAAQHLKVHDSSLDEDAYHLGWRLALDAVLDRLKLAATDGRM